MKKLIIIPAYNEEKNLVSLINEIREVPGFDYIIINDGSKDNTSAICKENGYNMIELPINLGIGAAVQTGYLYAMENDYDIAIQIDGDGQHDPRFLNNIIRPLEEGDADFVIGSRFLHKKGFQSTSARKIGISLLSGLIFILTGNKFYDITSGYRAVNKPVIKLFVNHYLKDFPEPHSIIVAIKKGFKLLEMPVHMRERMNGNSSIHFFKGIYYMMKVSTSLILSSMELQEIDQEGEAV